jgi:uncharacterized protein (DUF2336 family)
MQIPLDTEALERAGEARRGLLPYLEMAAKLLELLESVLAVFSKCALKSLNNQADFDSAIRRFDPSRPSQPLERSTRLPEKRENRPEIRAFRAFNFLSGLPVRRT